MNLSDDTPITTVTKKGFTFHRNGNSTNVKKSAVTSLLSSPSLSLNLQESTNIPLSASEKKIVRVSPLTSNTDKKVKIKAKVLNKGLKLNRFIKKPVSTTLLDLNFFGPKPDDQRKERSDNGNISTENIIPKLSTKRKTLLKSTVKSSSDLGSGGPIDLTEDAGLMSDDFNAVAEDNIEDDIEQLLEIENKIETEMANSQVSTKDYYPQSVPQEMHIHHESKSIHDSENFQVIPGTLISDISELPRDYFMDSISSQNVDQLQKLHSSLQDKMKVCMERWRLLSEKSDEVEKRMTMAAKKVKVYNSLFTKFDDSSANSKPVQGKSGKASSSNLLLHNVTSTPKAKVENFSFTKTNSFSSSLIGNSLHSSQSSSSKGTISSDSSCSSSEDHSSSEDDFEATSSNIKSIPVESKHPSVDKTPSLLNHPMKPKAEHVLKSLFGLSEFRENQLNAILTTLDGKDSFILMPTGGGKSLCYQLTALITDGVTVVVSPLRSLIFDQVQKLKFLKISANYLSSDISAEEEQQIFKQLSLMQPTLKLLYVTPEKISMSSKLISTLNGLYNRNKLDRFVIDEAHCVSQWGHDFRPDYKKLNVLRRDFPKVPIMGLTATATPRVQKDILLQLKMNDPQIFKQSFNRVNLQYFVLPKTKNILYEIVNKIKTELPNKSGIIYCFSRKDCDNVATYLQKNGISAASYHAGLGDKKRLDAYERWMKNRVRVVCATIAFGMGVDKPDVRFVFHYTIPKSVEGYFQESGRAGRDGRKSICVLYYSYQDVHKIKRMIEFDKDNQGTLKIHMDNLYRVVAYCENKVDCRRAQQIHYFGEDNFDSSLCKQNIDTTCDNCSVTCKAQQLDATEDVKMIIKSVNELCHSNNSNYRQPITNYSQRMTLNQFVDAFRGTANQKNMDLGMLALSNKGGKYSKMDAERLYRHLVLIRVLSEEIVVGNHGNVIAYLKLGPKFQEVLEDKLKISFSIHTDAGVISIASRKRKSMEVGDPPELKQLKEQCLEELTELRTEIANHNQLPNPETILSINVLRNLAEQLPATAENMVNVVGITENWFQMWGEEFLDLTKSYNEKAKALNIPYPSAYKGESSEPIPHYFDDGSVVNQSSSKCGKRKYSKSKKRKGSSKRGSKKGSSTSRTWKANNKAKSTITASRAILACKLGLLKPPRKKSRV